MAEDVLCEVKSCTFYEEGDKCTASSIYVVNQVTGQAETSDQTDCKTFEPRM